MARLILDPAGPDERAYELRLGAHTIGRTRDNDVCVIHPSLSRQHARLDLRGRTAIIEDLGSKNGTYVDGVRIDRHELRGPCFLRCGDVVLSFEPGPDESAASEPAVSDQAVSEPPMPANRSPTLVFDVEGSPERPALGELLEGNQDPGMTALHLRDKSSSARAQARLAILLEVSELLSSPTAIDDVLAKILDLAFEILEIDRATVLLAADREQAPEPRVWRTRQGGGAPEAIYSRQIVSYVMDQKVSALFSDTRSDPRLSEGASIVQQSICASMCAPLKARDRLLGALYVDNVTRSAPFSAEDLEFLAAFANQAAIAIDNARLSSELAEEAVAKNSLLRFFPPKAAAAIMQGRGALEVIETEATVLFSDISDYTQLTSQLRPRDAIELLNAYFPVMADIVFRHEGTLEKYIGDALLAVWGAPLQREDDAERALQAAIEMHRAVRELNGRLRLPAPLQIHVGINSGVVAAGNIGTARYLQYATIGDATNIANRVCGVASAGEIVIDERTLARLPMGTFELQSLGPVTVKGKSEPLELWRVLWH
ncbi:MAG: GAF domain-containing protein [Deltaproteobacteria bacterium]|nr:GAF domain-containing protein [Deltaproteobacteria bacterium]